MEWDLAFHWVSLFAFLPPAPLRVLLHGIGGHLQLSISSYYLFLESYLVGTGYLVIMNWYFLFFRECHGHGRNIGEASLAFFFFFPPYLFFPFSFLGNA